MLTFGGFLLLSARAGDILGRRRMLISGLVLFTLVEKTDAGAASGLVNVSQQIGNALGLAILISVGPFGSQGLDSEALQAHRIAAALMSATGMILAALFLVYIFIVRNSSNTSVNKVVVT